MALFLCPMPAKKLITKNDDKIIKQEYDRFVCYNPVKIK